MALISILQYAFKKKKIAFAKITLQFFYTSYYKNDKNIHIATHIYLVPDMYMCTYMFEIILFLQTIVCNVICYPLSFQMYIYIPPTLVQPISFDIKRSKRSTQPDKQTFL